MKIQNQGEIKENTIMLRIIWAEREGERERERDREREREREREPAERFK